jgi:hypothetical protein
LSDIYRELLPLVNSGRVELLDNPRLIAQLAGLERHTSRGGRDSIDSAPNAHEDLANACAGALVLAAQRPQKSVALIGASEWARQGIPVDANGRPDVLKASCMYQGNGWQARLYDREPEPTLTELTRRAQMKYDQAQRAAAARDKSEAHKEN